MSTVKHLTLRHVSHSLHYHVRSLSQGAKQYQTGSVLVEQVKNRLAKDKLLAKDCDAAPAIQFLLDLGVMPGKLSPLFKAFPGIQSIDMAVQGGAVVDWLNRLGFASADESWRETKTVAQKITAIIQANPQLLGTPTEQLDSVHVWLMDRGVRSRIVGAVVDECPFVLSTEVGKLNARAEWLAVRGIAGDAVGFLIEKCPRLLVDHPLHGITSAGLDEVERWMVEEAGVDPASVGRTLLAQPGVLLVSTASSLDKRIISRLLVDVDSAGRI
jgi:hypothetical protein